MFSSPRISRPRRGPLRWLARLPLWLYRARLGWLLGQRFLLLTHRGRSTGVPLQTVLEVIGHDPVTGACYVASGWGEQSDWYRNVMKTLAVTIQVANRRWLAMARRLPAAEAEAVLRQYASQHPRAVRSLGRLLGFETSDPAAMSRAMAQRLPIVELQPQAS